MINETKERGSHLSTLIDKKKERQKVVDFIKQNYPSLKFGDIKYYSPVLGSTYGNSEKEFVGGGDTLRLCRHPVLDVWVDVGCDTRIDYATQKIITKNPEQMKDLCEKLKEITGDDGWGVELGYIKTRSDWVLFFIVFILPPILLISGFILLLGGISIGSFVSLSIGSFVSLLGLFGMLFWLMLLD